MVRNYYSKKCYIVSLTDFFKNTCIKAISEVISERPSFKMNTGDLLHTTINVLDNLITEEAIQHTQIYFNIIFEENRHKYDIFDSYKFKELNQDSLNRIDKNFTYFGTCVLTYIGKPKVMIKLTSSLINHGLW